MPAILWYDLAIAKTENDLGRVALPNFFIGSVPKAGTTSLYKPVVDWDDYQSLFRSAGGRPAADEASVIYLWSKTAARNIAARIPHAKMVLMLRDPAERAYSQYLQAVSEGRLRSSFRAEVHKNMQRQGGPFGVLNPFLGYGYYFEQLQRFTDVFPPAQIRICLYEDYQSDARAVLRDLFRFLTVDETFTPDISEKFLQPRVPRFIGASYLLRRRGSWRRVKEYLPDGYQRAAVEASVRQRLALAMPGASAVN